jgi:hypothetical protein
MDKQFYIKLNYEWGVDNGDGTFEIKNKSDNAWISMPYEDSVLFHYHAISPALTLINEKAAEAGLAKAGIPIPGDKPPGQNK